MQRTIPLQRITSVPVAPFSVLLNISFPCILILFFFYQELMLCGDHKGMCFVNDI